MLGIGPIKSITNKTVKVAIGDRTCPAIGMKTIAVPKPEKPRTNPANVAPNTR